MKTMKLKSLDQVDLKKIFPVLNVDLYKIIEGRNIEMTTIMLSELKKNKSFSLGALQISEDLLDIPEQNAVESTILSVKAHMKGKALFMDDLVESLCHGIYLKENVLLYGKGGHNKSEGTLDVLNYLEKEGILTEKPYIKSLGDGTTVEDLFGGVKMKLALEEGVIEYNTENSFMNWETVVFEEGFDAPVNVLLTLKDIMSSGQFRNGNQIIDIKTKTFIVLTNRSKEEISKDDSINALAQRFGITCKVEWAKDAYNKNNFYELFKITSSSKEHFTKHKDKLAKLAKLCADSCAKGGVNFISPRSAVKASKLYCNGGSLRFVSEFDAKSVEVFEKEGGDQDEIKQEQEGFYQYLVSFVEENNLLQINNNAASKLLSGFGGNTGSSNKDKVEKINFLIKIIETTAWCSSLITVKDTLKSRLLTASNSY